jgi:Na+-driven multidrug efflux pump
MAWLFERTIETAAWVAFILGIVFLCESLWLVIEWARNMGEEGASHYLRQSVTAAASFVASALAMGLLACIDHYVFDYEERAQRQ